MSEGRRRRLVLAWAPPLLYMAFIWTLSSLDLGLSLERFPLHDKGAHVLEYGVLGFLLTHAAIRTWPDRHVLRTAALGVCVTVLFGWLDEIHQAFVPGRTSEALDLVADGAGALTGAGARAALLLIKARIAR